MFVLTTNRLRPFYSGLIQRKPERMAFINSTFIVHLSLSLSLFLSFLIYLTRLEYNSVSFATSLQTNGDKNKEVFQESFQNKGQN